MARLLSYRYVKHMGRAVAGEQLSGWDKFYLARHTAEALHTYNRNKRHEQGKKEGRVKRVARDVWDMAD